MSALDDLAPDQRAVLQMVLQRGRSYDEIAGLLSIDRAAVRQRALDAFDALTPVTVLPGPERALVTDYLLRQLPDRVAEQVYSFLQASDADRAWAQALAEVVGPLTSASLPEIPVGAPLGADDWAAGALEQDSDPPDPGGAEDFGSYAAPVADEPEARTRAQREPRAPREPREPPEPREPRPSSRRGGAILLSTLGVVIIAVIVVVIATSGGGTKRPARSSDTGSNTTSASTTVTTGTATSTTGTTSTAASTQILTQLNLSSPTGAKGTLGVVQVIRVDGVVGVALDAQGLPPNTAHNAYAVWLYNSASSFKFVGFVQTRVGKSGKVATEGKLPSGASSYHRLLITLETRQKPSAPGEVVLSGPFREHS